MSAIEAIRQTGDVKLTSRQVKTSRLSRKLFGMEGDLALKNFKRNRRRYRATVISLVVSIVLFVSASSFTHYMSSGTDSVYGGYTYDVSVYPRYEKDTDRVLPLLAGLPDVEEYAVLRGATGTVRVPREALSPRLLQNGVLQEDGDGYYTLEVTVQAFGESAFSAYLKRLGLDPAAYRDPEAPKARGARTPSSITTTASGRSTASSPRPLPLWKSRAGYPPANLKRRMPGRPSPSRWTSAPPPTPRPSAATRPRSTTTFSSMCRMRSTTGP